MKPGLRKTLKISGIGLGVVVGLLVAAALLLLFDKPLVRNLILRQLNKTAGMTAKIGRIDYTIIPFRVTAEALDLGQEDAFQKLGVSLSRFEARGSFWRLIRGAKPAFDVLEADGLSLRLEQKAVSEAPLDLEKVLLQASDTLAWAKRIALNKTRLSIGLLSGPAEIENLDLTLTPGPARDVIAYEIGRGDLLLKDKSGATVLAASLTSSGRIGLVSPFILDNSLELRGVKFAAAGLSDSLERVSLAVTGRFDKSAQELDLPHFKLAVPGLLEIEGRAVGKLGHGLFLDADAAARFDDLAAAAALFKPVTPAGFRDAVRRGRAELGGKYVFQRSDLETKDNLTATLTLDGVELSPVVAGRPLEVRATGRIETAGPTSDPRLAADLRASLGRAAFSGVTAAGAEIHLVASGTKAGADLSLIDAQLSKPAYAAANGKTIAFDRASLTAKGNVDLARKQAVLTSLEARLPGLSPLRLSGRYGADPAAAGEFRLEAKALDLPALRTIGAPFMPAEYAAWDLGGSFDLKLAASRPAGARRDWTFSGAVTLTGAKFNDPSFTIAGDGLDPVVKFEGTGSAAKGLAWSGSLDISRGESLWKSVYVAWAKHPLKLTASGRYQPGSGALDGLTARIALPDVGAIDIKGSATIGAATAFDLTADANMSLGPLYSLYSQAGVAEKNRTKLEGSLGANLVIRQAGPGLSVAGRIKLAETNVENPQSSALLLGITADLPLLYESPAPPPPAADAPLPESGRLHIGELQTPLLTLKPLDIAVRAGANALAVEPLGLDLFGGRLELGETTFRLDPATGSFRGLGSLVLKDVDISKFPVQSPQFKLTGKVQADFPRLEIGADKIVIAGRGEASVFGGKVVLRDLAVSEPFAAGRSISLNVDLLDLDMKKLTDEVPFGEVTGIVRGEIRDLVITYGQPESFFFQIESVPRKGVPQTFSLKAVDNLTVISSGQKASGGTSAFWMRFVRGFRYAKLGIVSTLHNDTFTLNGTIHEGGTEYLMKKPALFGISVVNREPNKKISFKEMVGRLKRVGQ